MGSLSRPYQEHYIGEGLATLGNPATAFIRVAAEKPRKYRRRAAGVTFALTQGVSRRFGDAVLLVFILAQVADGLFTYLGVTMFGVAIEGNPVVAWYIATFGAGVAIIAAKGFAVACAATLHLREMYRTIGILAVIYLVAAVLPWSLIITAASAR